MLAGQKHAIKTLKPSFFVTGVMGIFFDFPRHNRKADRFGRCLLCKVDLSITGRGLHNLYEHWKVQEHTRLEQKYRNMINKMLLEKSFRQVSAQGKSDTKQSGTTSCFRVARGAHSRLTESVQIRCAKTGEIPHLFVVGAAYLLLCCFFLCFVSMTSYGSRFKFVNS